MLYSIIYRLQVDLLTKGCSTGYRMLFSIIYNHTLQNKECSTVNSTSYPSEYRMLYSIICILLYRIQDAIQHNLHPTLQNKECSTVYSASYSTEYRMLYSIICIIQEAIHHNLHQTLPNKKCSTVYSASYST